MKKVLLLNKNYQALRVMSWKEAFVKMYSPSNSVEVVSHYDDFVVHSAYRAHKVPAVMVVRSKYVDFRRKVKKGANYKKYVYVRDGYVCQYCGKDCDRNELTVDHVIPKSKGGSNSWTNLVTCCKDCNNKKGDLSCEQAKMFPKWKPREITDFDLKKLYFESHNIEPEWLDYIPYVQAPS